MPTSKPLATIEPLDGVRDQCLAEAAQFLVDQLAALDAMTEEEAIRAFGCADDDAAHTYRRRLRSARREAQPR